MTGRDSTCSLSRSCNGQREPFSMRRAGLGRRAALAGDNRDRAAAAAAGRAGGQARRCRAPGVAGSEFGIPGESRRAFRGEMAPAAPLHTLSASATVADLETENSSVRFSSMNTPRFLPSSSARVASKTILPDKKGKGCGEGIAGAAVRERVCRSSRKGSCRRPCGAAINPAVSRKTTPQVRDSPAFSHQHSSH